MKILASLALCVSLAVPLRAQTIDDGIMMASHGLFTGGLYTHDSWDHYWEGSLFRVNGNIGTVTTETNTWFANYGVTNRLNVIGMVPIVWTNPSMGVLQGQHGVQDLTLAGKYRFFERSSAKLGTLGAIAVVSGAFPLSDYSFDFLPMSIGTQSHRVAGRLTLNYQSNPGWYVNGSTAYTWRGDVTLDRPYFYTNGQLFFTDQVSMPNVVDYIVSAGYLKHGLNTHLSFSQQITQGGGDIRRQDSPFVSNRMNFSKVGALVMAPLPKLPRLAFQFSAAYTVDGRNVGRATTFTAGLLYIYGVNGSVTR